MSVVVAIKHQGKVYIGADSQVTRGGTRTTLHNPNNYKIWKVRDTDNCLMAQVGLFREANVIRLVRDLVTDYDIYCDRVDYEFVVRKVVPVIINELKTFGYMKDEQFIPSMESRYLFAFRDKLFVIGTDCSVIEVDDCCAIGSGEDLALGSLLSTEGEDPRIRIVKAIKASATSDIYVDYPIIISDTENTEFEVISEKDEDKFFSKKSSHHS